MSCCSSDEFETPTIALECSDTGQPIDTRPERKNKVRNVISLALFIVGIVLTIYLASEGVRLGDPHRYISGVDSWGNVCGRKNNTPIPGVPLSGRDLSNHTFELRMAFSDPNAIGNILQGSELATVCVSECPAELRECTDFIQEQGYGDVNDTVVSQRVCTAPFGIILPHKAISNRCFPALIAQAVGVGADTGDSALSTSSPGGSLSSDQADALDNSVTSTYPSLGDTGNNAGAIEEHSALVNFIHTLAVQSITSFSVYWKHVVYLALICLVVAMVTVLLMQVFTRIVVIIMMVTAGLGTVIASAFLWYNYAIAIGVTSGAVMNTSAINVTDNNVTADVLGGISNITGSVASGATIELKNLTDSMHGLVNQESLQKSGYLLPAAIVSSIVAIISVSVLIWSRKSICLVLKIFDEASLAVFNMPALLIQPLLTILFLGGLLVFFAVYAAYMLTIQKPVIDSFGMVTFDDDPDHPMLLYLLPFIFLCLWIGEFFQACEEYVVAGAVGEWYFSSSDINPQKNSKSWKWCNFSLCPIFKPMKNLILYNLGSVALGSLIVGIVKFIRMMLAFAERQLEGKTNKTAKCLMKTLQCCLYLLEKILKYINRNAYICCAIYGDGFCDGAKRAVNLLISNMKHTFALNMLSSFVILLGKLAIVASMMGIGLIWFQSQNEEVDYTFPYVATALIAWLIAKIFFSVYSMAIDTIFICFCDDQQRNNGDDRPYFSSVKLQRYMTGNHDDDKEAKAARKTSARQRSARGPRGNRVAPSIRTGFDSTDVLDMESGEGCSIVKNHQAYLQRKIAMHNLRVLRSSQGERNPQDTRVQTISESVSSSPRSSRRAMRQMYRNSANHNAETLIDNRSDILDLNDTWEEIDLGPSPSIPVEAMMNDRRVAPAVRAPPAKATKAWSKSSRLKRWNRPKSAYPTLPLQLLSNSSNNIDQEDDVEQENNKKTYWDHNEPYPFDDADFKIQRGCRIEFPSQTDNSAPAAVKKTRAVKPALDVILEDVDETSDQLSLLELSKAVKPVFKISELEKAKGTTTPLSSPRPSRKEQPPSSKAAQDKPGTSSVSSSGLDFNFPPIKVTAPSERAQEPDLLIKDEDVDAVADMILQDVEDPEEYERSIRQQEEEKRTPPTEKEIARNKIRERVPTPGPPSALLLPKRIPPIEPKYNDEFPPLYSLAPPTSTAAPPSLPPVDLNLRIEGRASRLYRIQEDLFDDDPLPDVFTCKEKERSAVSRAETYIVSPPDGGYGGGFGTTQDVADLLDACLSPDCDLYGEKHVTFAHGTVFKNR